MNGWHTVLGPNGKTHYLVDGAAVCTLTPSGNHYANRFSRPWRPFEHGDRVCRHCARERTKPVDCNCWMCGPRRAGASV